MEIYAPSDDSFFFADFLKKELLKLKKQNKDLNFLEVGCGSCILSETASEIIGKENILCADINPQAVNLAKQKNFRAIQSDLFSKIPKTKFNIIIFNPPYLPDEKSEPTDSKLATTGGKRGDEIIIKFLNQSKDYLTSDGKIFLLISSLTPQDKIKKFQPKIRAEKKLFLEELFILEINSGF